MTYPPAITLRPCTLGGSTALESGTLLVLKARITASRGLKWGPTGWQFPSLAREVVGTEGAELSFSLPVTDLAGWRLNDDSGSIIDVSTPGSYTHTYTIKLTTLDNGRPVAERTIGPFALPTDDLSPIDLDLMLPAPTVAGGVVLVPDSANPVDVAAEVEAYLLANPPTGTGSGVDANDVGYDVILAAGQSNMWGQYGPVDPIIDLTDPRVFQWPASGDYATPARIIPASEPVAHPLTNGVAPTGMGPALVFSRWLALSLPSNRRVLIVPHAVGASALVSGDWAYPNGSLYTGAKAAVLAALAAAGPNARFLGIIWLQGESDALANRTQAQYAAAFDAMIAGFRSEIPGATDARVVVAGMVPEFAGGTATQIFAAHADTPNRVTNSAYVPGPIGQQQGDNLHYTGAGQRQLGKAMFYGGWLGDAWEYLNEPEVIEPPAEAEGFAEDTFAGRTTLGTNWTGGSADVELDGTDLTFISSGGYVPHNHVATPPSTDYSVRLDITPLDITLEMALKARTNISFYRTGNPGVSIVQGYDTLASCPLTYTSGATYRHILTVGGTTATGKVQRLSDGQWLQPGGAWAVNEAIAVQATVNAPSGVGSAGFANFVRATGTSIANFKATAVA